MGNNGQSESMNLEFKSCDHGQLSKGSQETISAFANTEGGQLLLGVADNGLPIGLSGQQFG